ncbi:MAG TPA: hypothetical protein VK154_11545 [Chitinophagales bacterium]|nr:hypothetical protein [Chitinophagales bacterium]
MNNSKQPWLHSLGIDSLFILLPPFATLAIIALLPEKFKNQEGMTTAIWVSLVLLIDVAHVYSTLYRTYFDKEMHHKHRNLLINIPLLAFIGGVLLYSIGAMVFWRVLAYIAVFHFIRQQYGFIRLYSRKETPNRINRTIDALAVYAATIYPVLHWHLSGKRNFDWFVEGDFYYFKSDFLLYVGTYLYIGIFLLYLGKETLQSFRSRTFNLPKNLLMAGTFISWFFGIVYFNGDVAFTALNVISHGIPYMALIWIFGKRKAEQKKEQTSILLRAVFSSYGIVLFLLILFFFSFVEEGVWDALVWNDHKDVFGAFYFLPQVKTNLLLAVIVPLLTLPQLTHYIIDGFIWKVRASENEE